MSNVRKVFWSWQSDQAERETRHLIRESLVQALNMLTGRTTLDERIEIDHDTKGMPGSPDIVSSILEKIDGADVFVADITPIAISKGGKHVANPNVLIELGYAKKALGLSKIVTVWNIAFTKSRPENLPFDLRGRRGPLTYSLDKDASRTELAKARALLVQGLAERVGACLRSPSAPTQAKPRWHDSIDEDKSIWVKPGQSIAINEAWGSGYKTVAYGGRWYVRVIPTAWSASWLEPISHGPVVGSYGGFSAGHTAEGLMTYAGSVRSSAPLELEAASMWFEDTGEIWSFQNRVGDDYKGRLVFFW
ncbi:MULTISPECIES: hypothetical protein [unclassified Sphingomonas]|uniref:hypothetical protein n=1 Tax=unclassified Sphingomonas TaxID=196159 RepID=UPI000B28833A|nr:MULTISPECIES: hypothetical protein [unclassified Sphingomonas]